jgi:GT2 family glycosyltransferase
VMDERKTLSGGGSRGRVACVGVVVPAHDEEVLLDRCLRALAIAAEHTSVPVRILVVCDACTDATPEVAAAFGAEVLLISARSVGAARAAGMAALLREQPEGLWLATTDADSVVGVRWIQDQLDLAEAGADAVIGVVELIDTEEHNQALLEVYEARYSQSPNQTRETTHSHVHGACLGIRATAYQRVGGFPPIPLHEDRELVAALEADPELHVVRTRALMVQTSARSEFRASGGLGTYLADLAERSRC